MRNSNLIVRCSLAPGRPTYCERILIYLNHSRLQISVRKIFDADDIVLPAYFSGDLKDMNRYRAVRYKISHTSWIVSKGTKASEKLFFWLTFDTNKVLYAPVLKRENTILIFNLCRGIHSRPSTWCPPCAHKTVRTYSISSGTTQHEGSDDKDEYINETAIFIENNGNRLGCSRSSTSRVMWILTNIALYTLNGHCLIVSDN